MLAMTLGNFQRCRLGSVRNVMLRVCVMCWHPCVEGGSGAIQLNPLGLIVVFHA